MFSPWLPLHDIFSSFCIAGSVRLNILVPRARAPFSQHQGSPDPWAGPTLEVLDS